MKNGANGVSEIASSRSTAALQFKPIRSFSLATRGRTDGSVVQMHEILHFRMTAWLFIIATYGERLMNE